MLDALLTSWNVLLMIFGFGLIIFIHELGHFVAARWAGIRVHAFALGFGPAVVSWRKGVGLRRGSTERAYLAMLEREKAGRSPDGADPSRVSPTEYRLNWLPLGGYVRMLGQEDGDPNATSDAPDSYTSKPVWKRMVVVSAGVVMNMILAAALFVGVYVAGMREAPALVGAVVPGSPAAAAGLEPGDRVVSINGRNAPTFSDLRIAAAMSGPGASVELAIDRPGEGRLTIGVTPERSDSGDPKSIGVIPAVGTALLAPARGDDPDQLRAQFERAGIAGASPGDRLVAIAGRPVEPRAAWRDATTTDSAALRAAVEASGGAPIPVTFESADGSRRDGAVTPTPEFMRDVAEVGDDRFAAEHLLGLTPLMRVGRVDAPAEAAGLRPGDTVLRVGAAEWPSIPGAIAAIRARAGETVDLVLLRDGERVRLTAPVSREGRIGFMPDPAYGLTVLADAPELRPAGDPDAPALRTPASRLGPLLPAGARVVAVGAEPVSDFAQLRDALARATAGALDAGAPGAVTLGVVPAPGAATETVEWTLEPAEVAALHGLGWDADRVLDQFAFAEFTMRAGSPADAVVLGVQKTHRIMMLTYLTFQRLFQGTVSPTELRGPVGITSLGSRYAEQGFVYLVFFLALISVNLAVINFLPIPVVDGGLFLMLLYEGITRRPVPIAVQNAATFLGLALIVTVFVFVTFNDISRLVP